MKELPTTHRERGGAHLHPVSDAHLVEELVLSHGTKAPSTWCGGRGEEGRRRGGTGEGERGR